MKRNIFLTVILMCAAYLGFTQSLQLSDEKGNIISNHSEIIQAVGPDATEIITYLYVKNIGSKTIEVLCKKTQMKMHDSTEVTMCWAGGCYPATTFISPNAQQMAPGQTVTDFVGHYLQLAFSALKSGESVVRWTFYDQSNHADSSSVVVKYDSYPLGVAENSGRTSSLSNVYPNPASAQAVVSYELPSASTGALIVRNMIGKEVYRQELSSSRGKAVINTVGFNDGLYFCTLLADDKPLHTKKMVVKH